MLSCRGALMYLWHIAQPTFTSISFPLLSWLFRLAAITIYVEFPYKLLPRVYSHFGDANSFDACIYAIYNFTIPASHLPMFIRLLVSDSFDSSSLLLISTLIDDDWWFFLRLSLTASLQVSASLSCYRASIYFGCDYDMHRAMAHTDTDNSLEPLVI